MLSAIKPYVDIARVDHWFKNVFMVLGVLIAFLFEPERAAGGLILLPLAVLATCLVASSNYVLNEVLDAPTDREHPVKKNRPVASGLVKEPVAYAEWLILAVVGVGMGFFVNVPFGLTALSLWIMALIYNVRPVRAKELPYLDVIVESVNNPIRLLLGWFMLLDDLLPPVSLLLAYWALGAFFMGTKRLAELRSIGDPERAARYRRSFQHYTEERLLVSLFFYVAACSFLGGVFIVRCKLELVLFVPFVAAHLAYYLQLGLKKDSPVQNPEKLYTERGFFAFTGVCLVVFIALMYTQVPVLYEVFNFPPPKTQTLWVVGE